jgi:hypothetical protein
MSLSQSPPTTLPTSLTDPAWAEVLASAPPESLRALLTWAISAYARQAMAVESGESSQGSLPPPVLADQISATEALIVINALLEAVHLNLFEVGMWQHIGRFAVSEEA